MELSDYAGQMLGSANTTRPDDDVQLVAQVSARTAAGKRHLRGVPVVGPGSLGGVIDGTDPLEALLAKEESGEIRWHEMRT